MGTGLLLIFAVALIAASAWVFAQATRHRVRDEESYAHEEHRWMPVELRTARLEASERDFVARIDGNPVPVRPDQIYRTADGRLVPVDSKTRSGARVFPSDVIEVSVQRLALAQDPRFTGNARVADYGYVRLARGGRNGRPAYKRIELMTEDDLTQLYRRYQDVVAGRLSPVCQTNPRACAGCGYRARCASAAT